MHPLGLIPARAIGWTVALDDAKSNAAPSVGIAPFDWNLELQSLLPSLPVGEIRGVGLQNSLGATLNLPLRFSYTFDAPTDSRSSESQHQISLVTQGSAAEVWLNHQPLTLACEEKQRRGENKKLSYEGVIPGKNLRAKNNLIEVRIAPPVAAGDRVLELSLSAAPRQVNVGARFPPDPPASPCAPTKRQFALTRGRRLGVLNRDFACELEHGRMCHAKSAKAQRIR
jgi:hypothetical protein